MSDHITERRRRVRPLWDHYDGFTDRRQPVGVVVSWVRVTGGHLVRSRVDFLHLSWVLRARFAKVRTLTWTIGMLLLARVVAGNAQSLIAPRFFDQHYVHLASKPVVALGTYAALGVLHVPNTTRTVLAIVGPSLVADVVWEFKDPGHFGDGKTVRDNVQDSFAASLGLILLRMRGWTRVLAVALWGTVEFGLGLHRWGEP